MRPVELAAELGISDKTLRSWLRNHFPRSPELHGSDWELNDEHVAAARDRWQFTNERRIWLFQANPSVFDLDEDLEYAQVGDEANWTVTRYGDEMEAGDLVILWQAGKDAGIRALGELTGRPYQSEIGLTRDPDERRIDLVYTQILAVPILKSDLLRHPVLRTLSVIKAPPGTNFRVTPSQWEALRDLLPGRRWDAFIEWARAFFERPDFDDRERTYKLQIASHMAAARESLRQSSPDWPSELGRAFGPPNNLTPWQAHSGLVTWAKGQPDEAEAALAGLWDQASSVEEAINAFASLVPASVRGGRGVKTNLASVLLMAGDPNAHPPFKVTPVSLAYKLVKYPSPEGDAREGQIYEHFLGFLDELITEAARRDLQLRDRLDAQSVMWSVITDPPPEDWPQSRRDALLQYRKGILTGSGLDQLVREFLDQSGYPTKFDDDKHRELTELVEGFTEEALSNPDVSLMRRFGAAAYGSPGPQPLFMTLVGTPEGLERVGNAFSYLLYGDGEVADRFDRILDDPDFAVAGLKEALLTKCLAVGRPDEWLPCYVSKGPRGKKKMIDLLGLEPPAQDLTTGQVAVDTNNKLYEALEPYFSGDPWGMQAFLWWLIHREEVPTRGLIDKLADKLLIDPVYLARIERLLRDKKQIIFYGPPGTGKTYVARELAAFLAQRPEALAKVQFHPSYAYEDFVEGWRPTMVDGRPGFALRDGPLKRLAHAADQDPAGTYVLLIDEINRGNVAKIFGELYFLLEYRDEEMALLYSEEPFRLPRNLLIIGTMNTADRSIALVDAALRRRFHFFPFFPDKPPIENLLHRWLQKTMPDLLWLADVVRRANLALGDSHSAIGPSHFLREDLSEEWIDLIWEHSVLPYIAEQFFGEEQRLAEFDLGRLRKATSGDAKGVDDPAGP